MTKTTALLGPALMLLLSTPGDAAETMESRYAPLQDCASVKQLALPGRKAETSGATAIFRCPGVGGYSVYVIEDDPRSFLVLERDKKLFSFERQMVSEFALGNFPNVAGAKKSEWRMAPNGDVAGLIVRVSYQRKDDAGDAASALFSFDLSGARPVLLGHATTNEEARALVDKAWSAKASKEKDTAVGAGE